jgi:hypothetical protein
MDGSQARQESRTAFGYEPALDGLRAVSVAAVIAYHLGYGWARGGYLGVDAFFVLRTHHLLLPPSIAAPRIDLATSTARPRRCRPCCW